MAKTITVWTPSISSEEIQAAIANQINSEVAAGNTSGAEIKIIDETVNQRTITREWVSVAAAETWIAFCETLEPQPISVTIEP